MTSMVVCAGCPESGQEHISVGSVPLRSYVLALDRMLLWGGADAIKAVATARSCKVIRCSNVPWPAVARTH